MDTYGTLTMHPICTSLSGQRFRGDLGTKMQAIIRQVLYHLSNYHIYILIYLFICPVLIIHVMTMSRHLRFSSSRHIFFAGESPSQLTDIDVANRGLFVEGIHFCLVLIGPACDPMIMWSVQTSKRSFTAYISEGRTLLASSAAAWKSSCESNDARLGTIIMSLRFLNT